MTYLIDSDVVADYLVAKPQATELLLALAQEGIGISLITIGEIYEGIYCGRDPHKAEAIFRQFLRLGVCQEFCVTHLVGKFFVAKENK